MQMVGRRVVATRTGARQQRGCCRGVLVRFFADFTRARLVLRTSTGTRPLTLRQGQRRRAVARRFVRTSYNTLTCELTNESARHSPDLAFIPTPRGSASVAAPLMASHVQLPAETETGRNWRAGSGSPDCAGSRAGAAPGGLPCTRPISSAAKIVKTCSCSASDSLRHMSCHGMTAVVPQQYTCRDASYCPSGSTVRVSPLPRPSASGCQ